MESKRRQGGVRGGVRRFDPDAFRRARIAANLTPHQLASRLGMSRQAVTRWESGATAPTPGRLLTARAVLNVTPEQLGMPTVESSTLAELRERAGWQAKALAAELGLDPTTYHSIEIGHTPVRDALLTRFAVALRMVNDDVEAAWSRSRKLLMQDDT